jgi:epoxyqueuosine reductase
MNETLRGYFDSIGVTHFSVIRYSDCREINERLRLCLDFTPKTAVVFLLPYYAGETVNISRYAASLDYHLILREVAEGLTAALMEKYPDAHFVGYGDHSPIDEVHAALITGLGIRGDNGLIINPKYGSYVFIGCIISEAEPVCIINSPTGRVCTHCGACRRACPTGILRGECADCLSAITQRKGDLTEEEVEMMRKFNTVWGCDLCQTSCPYNRSPKVTPIEFFHKDRIVRLDSSYVSSIGKDEFKNRAFAWRGKAPLLRNLEYYERRTDSDNE